MIGYERKNRDKSAGMRTHAIVALGAALMMVVSKYGFYDVEKVDSSPDKEESGNKWITQLNN